MPVSPSPGSGSDAVNGLRVLVVDDEPKLARALKAILHGNGFEPVLAATGEEALDLLDRQQPDLVLLDLALPGMDGLAVCRAIRQDRQLDLPIVILSAQGDEDAKVEALDLGADDYLTKPFGTKSCWRGCGPPCVGPAVGRSAGSRCWSTAPFTWTSISTRFRWRGVLCT